MIARGVYALAAAVLGLSLLALRQATHAVAHYGVTLPGGVPAVIYEPGEPFPWGGRPRGEPLPVVVLAHGFSANKGVMSSLARRLARGGYAVIAFDFRGHGQNDTPFPKGLSRDALLDDMDAAVLHARTSERFDGQRLAVAGHSMGGGVALSYASREPNVAATIGISTGWGGDGPYAPSNALLIWAAWDPRALREGARASGARFAGLAQLVLDRTYGEPERGTGVRLTEVGGDHARILYSEEAARRILEWLRLTLGPGGAPRDSGVADGRFLWAGLCGASWLVLLWGLVGRLAPWLPRLPQAAPSRPLARLGALLAAVLAGALLLAGGDAYADRGPAGFIPLIAARDLVGLLAIGGGVLLAGLALRGDLEGAALRAPRLWSGAGLLFAFVYLGLGVAAAPFVDVWPSFQRLPASALCALLALPFFAATEWLLRGPGRTGAWLPLAGRALVLVGLVLGSLSGLLSPLLMLGLGAFVLLFALLELFAWRLSRAAPNPWLSAVVQSAWLGWVLGAVFPYTG